LDNITEQTNKINYKLKN